MPPLSPRPRRAIDSPLSPVLLRKAGVSAAAAEAAGVYCGGGGLRRYPALRAFLFHSVSLSPSPPTATTFHITTPMLTMALSPSPPPPATAAAAPDTQQPPPPQLPHSPPDTSSTPASTSLGGDALPLPADAQRWSIDDVHRWAQSQALLAPVASILRQHAVDGHVLLNYVTNTILGEELGIAAFGTRVHILEAIEMLRWSLGQEKPSPQAKA
ncbi:hypothetical protein FBU31_005488, partial [Coemansia sp. 'formosensis']